MPGDLLGFKPGISSPVNDKVKYVRALQRKQARKEEGRFIAEGIRLIEDALRAGFVPALVFFVPGLEEAARGAALLRALRVVTSEIYPVSESVMKAASDTVTSQGVLAVLPFPTLTPRGSGLLLVIDGVQDPGNLGTLLRSAEAAGVQQVVLAPGTVDAFNSKVVRAGAGTHFRLPMQTLSWQDIAEALMGKVVRLAEEGAATAYYNVDWRGPSALIVSNEGAGASAEARALATEMIAIPMRGGTESLNVGVAASVILFEAARQRTLLTTGGTHDDR